MAIWNLSEIRAKVRQVTGRFSSNELPVDSLDEYINKYYQYTFPAEVKLERFHTYYEFLTSANQQVYTLPSGYINFEPPGTMDNQILDWYQEPATFEDQNPYTINRENGAVGDGVTVGFAFNSQGTPILPGSLVITDNVEVFQDTSTTWTTANVILTGSAGGTATINYSTGAISVTFSVAPASGQNIILSYSRFIAGRPTSVLLYNNQFKFYPVPDTAYRFKAKAYANNLVTTLTGATAPFFVNSTDRPLLDEWGQAIAYGTARDIFSDYGENDAYGETTALYREQLAYILRRTNQNLLNTRAVPHF